MRNHLIAELENLAEQDSRIYLFTGDLGYGVLDRFQEKFPERFINAGISEQNMTAAAAGMALEGNTVYTYSIGNFPGMRALEQIRNDICYPQANVKIIVVGGGFAYGQLGMSHHATEDLAIMRALPGMRVLSPADPQEAVETVRYANAYQGPCYIRLGKGREPELHPDRKGYPIEKILPLREGRDAAVIGTGAILGEALKAADLLKIEGIELGIYNCICVKPFDEEFARDIVCRYPKVVTLEEGNIIGGLGSAVCETAAGISEKHAKIIRMGLQDEYTAVVGSQDYLRDYYHMSARYIVEMIKKICR